MEETGNDCERAELRLPCGGIESGLGGYQNDAGRGPRVSRNITPITKRLHKIRLPSFW